MLLLLPCAIYKSNTVSWDAKARLNTLAHNASCSIASNPVLTTHCVISVSRSSNHLVGNASRQPALSSIFILPCATSKLSFVISCPHTLLTDISPVMLIRPCSSKLMLVFGMMRSHSACVLYSMMPDQFSMLVSLAPVYSSAGSLVLPDSAVLPEYTSTGVSVVSLASPVNVIGSWVTVSDTYVSLLRLFSIGVGRAFSIAAGKVFSVMRETSDGT